MRRSSSTEAFPHNRRTVYSIWHVIKGAGFREEEGRKRPGRQARRFNFTDGNTHHVNVQPKPGGKYEGKRQVQGQGIIFVNPGLAKHILQQQANLTERVR